MGSATPRVPLELSPNAMTVLEKRYLVRDDLGKPAERAEDLFWRVARTIAAADRGYGASDGAVEALADAFYELMAKRLFMPNSPTLMNAGIRSGSCPPASCCRWMTRSPTGRAASTTP